MDDHKLVSLEGKKHGGHRPGAGRKATGRKKCQYYLTDTEDKQMKNIIKEIREYEAKISVEDVNNEEFEVKIICSNKSDREYRDAFLKAYVCAVLDLKPTEFYIFKEDHKQGKDKGIIKCVLQDAESRLARLLEDI